MKTAIAEREVELNAGGDSSVFTISNNAKIFRLLIDGLYENKIQSITREIWSNALDSHVEAGTPERPFDVTLPSPFDATFRVRDYGVSLTHEQVLKLYTDLGNSTKEDTNDAVGKFGIGSKSPFAYTDTFTVTTVLDGVKRVYSAVVGADGVPAIHSMGTMDTDEENGVEVSFPVETQDIRAFRTAAKRVGHGFDVKPNINGDFEGWYEPNVVFKGTGWTLYDDNPLDYSDRAYAKMGPVLYPISASALSNDLDTNEQELLNHNIIFDIAMGDLEISASRESLSYGRNEPTIPTLVKAIRACVKEMAQNALDSYEAEATYWDACVKWRADRENNMPESVKAYINKNASWQGEPLVLTAKYSSSKGLSFCALGRHSELSKRTLRFEDHSEVMINFADNTVFVLEDMTVKPTIKRVGPRIKKLVDDRLVCPNSTSIHQIVWVRFYGGRDAQNSLTNLLADVDGAEVFLAEDLAVPETFGYTNSKPVSLHRVTNYGRTAETQISGEQFDEGGYYIKLERGYSVEDFDFGDAVMALRALGALDECYAIPKTHWKRFENAEQWIPLRVLVDEEITKIDFDIQAFVARRETRRHILNNNVLRFMRENIDLSRLDGDSTIVKVLDWWNTIQDEENNSTIEERRSNQLTLWKTVPDNRSSYDNPTDDDTKTLGDEYADWKNQIREVYPLMDILFESMRNSWNRSEEKLDKLHDYVNMCDTLNERTNQPAAKVAA